MRTNELKAVLAKTNEVAIWPAHIEQELPPYLDYRRNGRLTCPLGLVHAKVIETGVTWEERRPVTDCGDQDYAIPHRNGVLVEIADTPDKLKLKVVGKRVYFTDSNGKRTGDPVPHTEAVTRNGHRFVRMIVSHKAILSGWGEYALTQAQREKDKAEQAAKHKRLYDAQSALMGLKPGERHPMLNVDSIEEYEYLPKRDEQGNHIVRREHDYKRDEQGNRIVKREQGRIQITVEQAEKIISLLTPKQRKALASR